MSLKVQQWLSIKIRSSTKKFELRPVRSTRFFGNVLG